jgi:hypothetical protein
MKRYIIFLSFILFAISCAQEKGASSSSREPLQKRFPESFPLARIVEDSNPTFNIDPMKPFTMTFGKGSGWVGLDTIEINENGKVVLHRIQVEQRHGIQHFFWETGKMQLLPEDITAIIDSLYTFHIFTMHKQYHANIHDGTQWVLWIKQEQHEKSIYCNNHFPNDILAFSDFLDDLLTKRGLSDVTWTRVPEHESRNHEKELWESIR